MNDLALKPNFELQLECGATLAVRQFSAVERLSTPFEVIVEAVALDPDVPLDQIVGRGAGLILHGPRGRSWTGVCREIEQLHGEAAQLGVSRYLLRIAPDLWLLSQRRGHRIFQHQSTIAIVEQLLAEWTITAELRLDRDGYPVHEYRVQYGETDLEFVSRLLEEAGVFYYFGLEDAGGGKRSHLVLSDEPLRGDKRKGQAIHYVDHPNEASGAEYVTEVRLAHGVRSGQVSVRDYDFRRPAQPRLAQATPAPAPEHLYEHYRYLPGVTVAELELVPDDKPVGDARGKARSVDAVGKRRAERMLEGLRSDKRAVELATNCFDVACGTTFAIEHPRADLGATHPLLAVETMAHGAATTEWTMAVRCAFAEKPWRPARQGSKPRVEGPQSAIVVGPAGSEIHSDEHGRVRVRFHWDRERPFDDSATCWLRVNQPWAGAGYGQTYVPRVGHEVLVEFLDGDPDQPVVIGRVYNAVARQPYTLPEHKTKSVWKTDTTPHKASAFHEISFDDQKGAEVVFVQSQGTLRKLVKRHETERTGAERLQVVGEDRTAVIGKVDSIQVGGERLVKIAEPKKLKILEMGDPELDAKKTFIELRDKKITLTTGGTSIVIDGDSIIVNADAGIKMHADGPFVIEAGSKVYFNAIPGEEVMPNVDKIVADRVVRPRGRVAASILKLLGEAHAGEKLAREGFALKQ